MNAPKQMNFKYRYVVCNVHKICSINERFNFHFALTHTHYNQTMSASTSLKKKEKVRSQQQAARNRSNDDDDNDNYTEQQHTDGDEQQEGFPTMLPDAIAEDGVTFDKIRVDMSLFDEPFRLLKWTKPTKIQAAVIPEALDKKDVIALAETGSG